MGPDLSKSAEALGVEKQLRVVPAAYLEGATMPNGQQYEDWLKSRGRNVEHEYSLGEVGET